MTGPSPGKIQQSSTLRWSPYDCKLWTLDLGLWKVDRALEFRVSPSG